MTFGAGWRRNKQNLIKPENSNRCPVCGGLNSSRLRNNCPACLLRLCASSEQEGLAFDKPREPPPAWIDLKATRRLGDYELLEEIARGGMGAVYRARQVSLNRLVAVKVLLAGGFASQPFLKRFGREAEAAASLNHPNIVSIYEVGEHQGQPYFSMQLIEGRSLAELVRDKPLPARQAAQFLKTIAEAVHFAHGRGLLHRDLKPSNVLVDAASVPHITDSGLAKRIKDSDHTVPGQILATPNYMPPEQADSQRGPTTAASDVYSLGAILYELLTGRPPFLAETLTETLRLVTEGEPVSPRLLNPGVPRDLETICMRCLERDPLRRYASAQELADELGRFLRNEPIHARPIGRPAQLARWCRRKPALASALGAGAALLLIITIGSPIAIVRIDAARKQEARMRDRAESAEREQSSLRQDAEKAQASEEQARRRAEAQELAARKKAYASDMKLVQHALAVDDLGRAQDLLNRQRPEPGERDLRGWEWRYLWQFCRSDAAFTVAQRPSSILSVSFSSDGTMLGIGGASLSDVSAVNLRFRTPFHSTNSASRISRKLSFAPSGDIMAYHSVSNRQHWIVLNDVRTRSVLHRLPVNAAIRNLAFTSDGRLFVADASNSSNVSVWNVAEGSLFTNFTARLPTYLNSPGFAITETGNLFAHVVSGSFGSVRIINLNDTSDPPFRVAEEYVTALAFSPDGETLVTAGGYSESAIKLWDVRTRQQIGSLESHRSWVSCLKFLPDRKTLASSSADRTIRLWDIGTRRLVRTLRARGGELWTFDVSPDGRLLASGGKDGSVMMWDFALSTNRAPAYRMPIGQLGAWGYSPDGRWLAAIQERRLKLYDAATFQLVSGPTLALTNLNSFAFSPDTRLLVVAGAQGNVGVWDLQRQQTITNFVAHSAAASVAPHFGSNGKSVLTHGLEGVFKEWDVATWQEVHRVPGFTNLASWAFSPAANLVGTARGGVALIPLHEPQNTRRFRGEPRIVSVTLSSDGKTVAAASENGTVEIWDTETLTRRALLGGVLLGYHSVAVSHDGQRLVAGSTAPEAAKLWDLESHEEVATLAGQGSLFTQPAFSPHGDTIGARNANGVLHLWTAPTWKEIEATEATEKARAIVPPNSNIPSLLR